MERTLEKVMDMPANCAVCPFTKNGYCLIKQTDKDISLNILLNVKREIRNKERSEQCPLNPKSGEHEGVTKIEIKLINSSVSDAADVPDLMGYCYSPMEPLRGFVTRAKYKAHRCGWKRCPYFFRFSDLPISADSKRNPDRVDNHKKERKIGKKIHVQQKSVIREIKALAQKKALEKGYEIVITGVIKTDAYHYTINYVSFDSRNDWREYADILDGFKERFHAGFRLNHIRKADRTFATIDDLLRFNSYTSEDINHLK